MLGGVDERIDAAVGHHQHHAEMIEPAREIDGVVDQVHEEEYLVERVACDESAAYHE